MAEHTSSLDFFVQSWAGELGRAIGMFTGQELETRSTRIDLSPVQQSDSDLWVSHTFVETGSFTTWVGAQDSTWKSLGAALGGEDEETLRSTFLEIVNQAQQGSAGSINSRLGRNLLCKAGEAPGETAFSREGFELFQVEFVGGELSSICFAVEASAVDVLGPDFAPQNCNDRTAVAPQVSSTPEHHGSSTFNSLLAVKLPVLLSLGKTKLSMQQALSTRPGTIIPMSKDAGELVDLVVHGKVVARGEIVLVKGNYGFRVKHVVSWHDRLAMCQS